MTFGISKLEYYKVHNSLSCIPFILLNRNTVIDLWNDTSVAGSIQDVDGFMNITMTNVVFIDQQGKMRPLDNFFVLARNVKYIHIPKEVNALSKLIIFIGIFLENEKSTETFNK